MNQFNHTIKIFKYKKIEDKFVEDGFDKYEISYKQVGPFLFRIYVDGFDTNLSVDTNSVNFDFRKRFADAIKKYKRVHNAFTNHISTITKFNDRDELTKLELF